MVFRACNIGQHGRFVAFDNQTHGNSRAGRADRNTGIHQRERTAADCRHGGGAVRFQNIGHKPHRVREVGFRRKQVEQSAFGQCAVPDLAAARSAQEFHFANGKRRKVVVQHETLERLFLKQQVEPLLVFFRSERGGGQGLGLSACEQRRAVRARQHSHFAGDLPNLVERACVRPPVAIENVLAEIAFAQPLKRACRQRALLFVVFRNRFKNRFLDVVDQVVAFFLRVFRRVQGIVQPRAVFLFDLLGERFIERERGHDYFVRLQFVMQLADRRDDALDLVVGELQRVRDRVFADFHRACFHHHDGVLRRNHDDVQQTRLLFGNRRVGHEFAFDQTDSHRRHRCGERRAAADFLPVAAVLGIEQELLLPVVEEAVRPAEI